MAGLKDIALQHDLRLAPAAGKIAPLRLTSPHPARMGGEEQVRLDWVTDHPEIDPHLDVVRMPVEQ